MREIFTLELPDKSQLDIEADSPEQAQAEANAEWSRIQSAPKEPGFFSPSEVAGRAGRGLLGMVPGVGTYQAYKQGVSGPEKAGAIAGDVGNAAMLLAAPVKATVAAGLGAAGLEASGINEGARRVGAGIENAYEPKTQSVTGNMLLNAPKYAASTLLEALPSLLIGKAIAGKGGRNLSKPAMGTPETRAMAAQAEAKGIPITPGMLDPKLAKEAGYSVNAPKITGDFQARQGEAIKQALSNQAIRSGMTPGEIGKGLLGGIESKLGKAGEKFTRLEGKLGVVSSKKDAGVLASNKVISQLEEAGVPSGNKGFDLSRWTGNEKMTQDVADSLITLERKVRNAKTVEDLINQRRQFDTDSSSMFKDNPGAAEHAKKAARRAINETIYETLLEKDEKLANKWKQANDNYHDVKDSLDYLGGEGKIKDLSPEDVFSKTVLKNAESANRMKSLAGADKVKEAAKNHVLSASMDVDGKFSLARLKKVWKNTLDTDTKRVIFGNDPYIKQVDDLIALGDVAENPYHAGKVNVSGGSQTKYALGRSIFSALAGPTAGAGTGAVLGGPGGAGIGAVAGWAIPKVAQGVQQYQASKYFNQPKGFYLGKDAPRTLAGAMALRQALAAQNSKEK